MNEVANKAGRFFNERLCEFDTDGNAWTVIQKRFAYDNGESFNRTKFDYKFGFGSLDREFWFGNEFIHNLTFGDAMMLRINLPNRSGRTDWIEYSTFKMESEKYNYKLTIDGFSGSVDESVLFGKEQKFQDRNDSRNGIKDLSCVSTIGNKWWFTK